MSSQRPVSAFPWSVGHRRALLVLLTLLLIVLFIRYIRNPAFITDPQPEIADRAGELCDRLDPNHATWEELAAIPSFGEKKARALVTYREKWIREHQDPIAFHEPQDLRNVKGIGPATISNMSPYLVFPGAKSSGKAK